MQPFTSTTRIFFTTKERKDRKEKAKKKQMAKDALLLLARFLIGRGDEIW